MTGAGANGAVIQGNIIGLDPDGATGGGNTDVIYLRYAEATEIVDTLMGVGKIEEKEAQQGKAAVSRSSFDIQSDEATNSLVITAPPDIMRTLGAKASRIP